MEQTFLTPFTCAYQMFYVQSKQCFFFFVGVLRPFDTFQVISGAVS